MDEDKTKKHINENLSDLVKEKISELLGTEPDDIQDEDSLSDHLHMKASDLFDLIESLKAAGIETTNLELSEIDTVSELIEALGDNEYLD